MNPFIPQPILRPWLWALWLLVLPAGPTRAQTDVRVTEVTPARVGDLLVCRLVTEGLPGERLLASMHSGLVSAVDFDLAVIDERERVIGGNRLSLQLAFDLWEEIFSVRGDGVERRFEHLEDLQVFLADIEDVPVAPLDDLTGDRRYRVRVGFQVHAIAPAQRDRVEEAIAGDRRPRREGQDQQEASVSLGCLIRFFYKGGGEGRTGEISLSAWFTRKELDRATH